MWLPTISFVALVTASAQAALPLPPFLTKCTTREPAALNACATENARRAVAAIAATGDRKYGVAPFDPAFIEKLTVEENGFFLEFSNMTISTLPRGSWHIDSVDLNLDNRYIHFRYSTPTLVLKSNYRIQGRILLVHLKGSGDCEVRYENYSASNTVFFDVVKNDQDGLRYVKLKNTILDANVTKSTYKFNNLFQGQETLNKAVLEIANQNWKEIYEDTKESTEEAFGQFVTSVLQSVFNLVPYEDVFPQ
ncbi:hypothetical protein R5R35_011997 [Gryllus longicercus]|uniref:Uncharacterized protein n=1 Tax=Gryllus longicercus TaxID=2509291 RepID=A0AAN9VXJ7_9ORTH